LTAATATGHPNVVAGVLSHVAERVAAGEGQFPAEDAATSATTRSAGVGRVFEEAKRTGVQIRVIAPEGDDAASLEVSEQAKLRIIEANAAGLIVIVPEKAITLDGTSVSGWWLVDPATGATADEMEDGRGVEGGEYTIPLTAEARAINAFLKLAACVGKYAVYARGFFGAGSEAAAAAGAPGVAGAMAVGAAIASGAQTALGAMPAAGLC